MTLDLTPLHRASAMIPTAGSAVPIVITTASTVGLTPDQDGRGPSNVRRG